MTDSDAELFKDMDPFFNPKRIALVGASADYRKLGNSILMNLLASEIDVFPITRNRNHVLGVKAYPDLASPFCLFAQRVYLRRGGEYPPPSLEIFCGDVPIPFLVSDPTPRPSPF